MQAIRLYELCPVCGGDLPECEVCSPRGVVEVGLTMAQVDRFRQRAEEQVGLTLVEAERLAELLECDPDFGSLAEAMIRRNRERDRMLKTISRLRAGN